MNHRLLLADDDDEMRLVLEDELSHAGWDVEVVRDGADTLETLARIARMPIEVPDAIIMDVRMPGCSGMHILAALRRAGWTTPVILITAFGDERTHREAWSLGATAMLDKPFPLDALRVAVAHALHACE